MFDDKKNKLPNKYRFDKLYILKHITEFTIMNNNEYANHLNITRQIKKLLNKKKIQQQREIQKEKRQQAKMIKKQNKSNKKLKPVICPDLNISFKSMNECAKYFHVGKDNISKAIRNNHKVKGHSIKLYEEKDND